MTHNEFIELVREMRFAQKQYFKYRTQSFLTQSKDIEKQVDSYLADNTENQQQRLF